MAAPEFYVRIFVVKTRCKEEECATWARLCPRERGRGRGGAGEWRPRGTLRLHHSPGGGAPRLFSPLCSLVTLTSCPLVCFDGQSVLILYLTWKANSLRSECRHTRLRIFRLLNAFFTEEVFQIWDHCPVNLQLMRCVDVMMREVYFCRKDM